MERIFFIILFQFLPICSIIGQELPSHNTNKIYVVSQGWHTGIIVSTNCIADSLWPENYTYHQFDRLLIGWGDTDYYQNSDFNFWYATKAALWSTPSTLHVKSFNKLKSIAHLTNEIVRLEISEENYKNLCIYIQKQFQLNDKNQFIPQKAGFYSNSCFFESNRNYTAINNSNVWTAKALKEAGFTLNPYKYLTENSIIKKVKKINSQKQQNE